MFITVDKQDEDNEGKPKHRLFRDQLLDMITNEQVWTPGSRIPAERELQKRYGISRNTVRKAIGDLVDAGYLFSEVGRGTFVNARSSWDAKRRAPKSKNVGLIITDVRHDFGKKVARGAGDFLHTRGYSLVLCEDDGDIVRARRYVRTLVDNDVRGVILDPVFCDDYVTENTNILNILDDNGIPAILVDRSIPGIYRSLVHTNNAGITASAVDYLFAKGHRRILVVRCPGMIMDLRYDGVLRSFREHGVPSDYLQTIDLPLVNKLEKDIDELLNQMSDIAAQPTAVLSMSEYLGQITYRTLARLRGRIREDVSFMTFDHPEDSSFQEGRIAFVQQPAMRMGEAAAKILIELIENGSDSTYLVELKSKLTFGESVRECAEAEQVE